MDARHYFYCPICGARSRLSFKMGRHVGNHAAKKLGYRIDKDGAVRKRGVKR